MTATRILLGLAQSISSAYKLKSPVILSIAKNPVLIAILQWTLRYAQNDGLEE